MMYILCYIFIAIITQILTYKLIKHIDKKERKKLQVWEQDYILRMNELKNKKDNKSSEKSNKSEAEKVDKKKEKKVDKK